MRLDGSGEEVTAPLPQSRCDAGIGAAVGRIWLEPNEDSEKEAEIRLAGWRTGTAITLPGSTRACRIRFVGEALRAARDAEVAAYQTVRAEVKYGLRQPR